MKGKTVFFFAPKGWRESPQKVRELAWKFSLNNRVLFLAPGVIDPKVFPQESKEEVVFCLSSSFLLYLSLYCQKESIFNVKLIRLLPFRNFWLSRFLNTRWYRLQKRLLPAGLRLLFKPGDVVFFTHPGGKRIGGI
jgi:hypothetical protein